MISLKGTFFDLRPKSNSRRVLLVARSDRPLLEELLAKGGSSPLGCH